MTDNLLSVRDVAELAGITNRILRYFQLKQQTHLKYSRYTYPIICLKI